MQIFDFFPTDEPSESGIDLAPQLHNETPSYPAKLVLFNAAPGHGKTSTLQACIARDVLEMSQRKTDIDGSEIVIPPTVIIYDNKREHENIDAGALEQDDLFCDLAAQWRATFGDAKLGDLPNTKTFWSAGEAAESCLDHEGKAIDGIFVCEELFTVEGSDYKSLRKVCSMRRKDRSGNGLTVYATAQRPKGIPVAFRVMCDVMVNGRMIDWLDIQHLAFHLGKERAAKLKSLGVGAWDVYHSGSKVEFELPIAKKGTCK